MNYTSLETSKKIYEAVFDGKGHPAYSFTDLLEVIEVLGKERGWTDCSWYQIGSNYSESIPQSKAYQHKLLDAYLADKNTIGTHVEAFIRELIEV